MTATPGSLYIRADSDTQIGTGHVMRTLALGQAWRARGGLVTFISRCESGALRERIESEGMEFIPVQSSHPDPADLPFTLGQVEQREAACVPRSDAWLVVDGYAFDAAYHLALRRRFSHVLVMDDMAQLPRYHATVVHNQNIGADQLRYVCDPDTPRLLGPRYALLRAEFLRWSDWRRTTNETVRRVVVTLGGSDPQNATLLVMESLLHVTQRGFETDVVVGPQCPHLPSLQDAASRSTGLRILTRVADMAELMAQADLAVSAAGATCWELAFMGLPTITLVLAPNQQRIAEGLASAGGSINLGPLAKVSAPLLAQALDGLAVDAPGRQAMTNSGRTLVDGRGASRVVDVLASLSMTP